MEDDYRVTRLLALDLTLWYAAPAIFLSCYVGLYSAPLMSVWPHLLVVGLPFASVATVRLIVTRSMQSLPVSQFVGATLMACSFALTWAYYVLVLIGLHSWHGVVSWSVLPTIFVQGPQMFGPALTVATNIGLATTLVALAAACLLYLRRFDWTPLVCRKLPLWLLVAVVLSALTAVAAEAYNTASGMWKDSSEPVSLTIFPLDHELEGHAIDPMIARNTDQRDATARSRYLPAIQASRRNVVLIVVDALRPDHMGVYGYTRNTTPYLSALEQTKAVRKVVAHASCGDTICGLLSLATSKFPRAFSFHPFSLHEVLKLNGYTIRLILSGDHSNFYGLKRFYGAVDSFFDGTQADGYALNDDQAVVDHVSNMPVWDGKPVMLQFHLMSAHVLRKVEDNAGTFEPAHRYLLRSGHDIGARSIVDRAATNFYDNGVVKADSVIQSLLAALGRKGYLTDTLVVITADHGESLGEHGLFQHANSVREQLLRIPLMLVSFGYTPAAELDPNRFASQVDIAPTILAEVQIVPPYTWAGRALQTAIQSDFTFFEEHQELGLFDHRDPKVLWKYWADPRTGEQHAFNLSADPEEGNDQLASLPRSLLAQWQYRALSDAPK